MTVPVASEAGQGLDDRDRLPCRGPKARPVTAAKDPHDRTPDCGRKVHGARVVPDVNLGLAEERRQEGKFAVLAEPYARADTAELLRTSEDPLHGTHFRLDGP